MGSNPKAVYERSYFHNWALSKTSYEWVSKWDGDMVAFDWLPEKIRELTKSVDAIHIPGVEIAQLDPLRVSKVRPQTSNEMRFWKMSPRIYFKTMEMSVKVVGCPQSYKIAKLRTPGFLHFKRCKNKNAALRAWPANWQKIPHFQKIYARDKPGGLYEGEVPQPIRELHARSEQRDFA